MNTNFIVAALLLSLTACSPMVNYKLKEDARWTGPKIDGVLCVRPFADRSFATSNRWEVIDNQRWRSNYREGYDSKDLGRSVATMVAKHLAYSGLFSGVVYGTNHNCDLVLTGTLADFLTLGRINSAAEGVEVGLGAGFGLLGALVGTGVTAGKQTEIRTSVTLDDLKITDATGTIVWQDSIHVKTNFPAHFSEAEYDEIFKHPNDSLKVAVTELIHKLGNSPLTNRASVAPH